MLKKYINHWGGSYVAVNENVLKREDAKDIISLIVNAKEEYQAQYGSDVAVNKKVLEREDAKDIVNLIVNTRCIEYAKYISNVAIDEPFTPTEVELYKGQFLNANEYINFMDELEKSSDEELKRFVKKFRN